MVHCTIETYSCDAYAVLAFVRESYLADGGTFKHMRRNAALLARYCHHSVLGKASGSIHRYPVSASRIAICRSGMARCSRPASRYGKHLNKTIREQFIFNSFRAMERSFNGYIQYIDDYSHEPVNQRRYDLLVVQKEQPFNAEPKAPLLVQHHVTPTERFYVRSHGPVPACPDSTRFRLVVDVSLALEHCQIGAQDNQKRPGQLQWSLETLREKFKFTEVEACLQCAGNRRTELVDRTKRPVKGVGWHQSAIGNARWGGFLLADLLRFSLHQAGLTDDAQLAQVPCDVCIEMEGADWVPEEEYRRKHRDTPPPGYMASLPWSMVMGDGSSGHAVPPVLLATHMNGAPLTADHGYPLRCVAPGIYGARSVKWLWRIGLRRGHSDGYFVERDYKVFSPAVDAAYVRWDSAPPLLEVNVQCAACVPAERAWKLWASKADRHPPGTASSLVVPLWGYAFSGGGRRIIRVDISGDAGATWTVAQLIFGEKGAHHAIRAESARVADDTDDAHNLYTPGLEPFRVRPLDTERPIANDAHRYAWCRWYAKLAIQPPCEVWCRAVDESANTQPDDVRACWNFRGVAHNSVYRIRVESDDGPRSRL